MRTIILLAHVSLDGFMAGPGGDIGFVTVDDEIGDHVYPLMTSVATAIYGRVTYQMMEGYWPSVVGQADAGAPERAHARWYLGVEKIVASRTLPASADSKVQLVGDDLVGAVAAAKRKPGGDLMIFGSPSVARQLAAHDLIDEWQLCVQPVLLGDGVRAFDRAEQPAKLALRSSRTFRSGVIAAHYVTRR